MAFRTNPGRRSAPKTPRAKLPRVTPAHRPRGNVPAPAAIAPERRGILAGGAVAAGVAATGAVVMRRRIAKMASRMTSEAGAFGRDLGRIKERLFRSLGANGIDVRELVRRVGADKPSLVRRLLQPVGAALALVAVTAGALLYLAPDLAFGSNAPDDARRRSSLRRASGRTSDGRSAHHDRGGSRAAR